MQTTCLRWQVTLVVLGAASGGSSSSISIREPLQHFPPSPFKIGESHTFTIQMKPPKQGYFVELLCDEPLRVPWCFGFRVWVLGAWWWRKATINKSKSSMLELMTSYYTNQPIERCSAVCPYFVQRGFTILPLVMRETPRSGLYPFLKNVPQNVPFFYPFPITG